WAAFFYGEKGTLKASVNEYEFIPFGKKEAALSGKPLFEEDKYPEDRTEQDLERHVASALRDHWRNFLHCRETREMPISDIELGHITTASCILANHSMKLGRSLTWDPVKHEVVNDDEANKLLRREYRKPWVHPEVAT